MATTTTPTRSFVLGGRGFAFVGDERTTGLTSQADIVGLRVAHQTGTGSLYVSLEVDRLLPLPGTPATFDPTML